MATKALINPFIMARINKGFEIKFLVAPTICMVLIKKRLLNMANLIVLSILIITMIDKMMESTKNINPILVVLSFKLDTKFLGY